MIRYILCLIWTALLITLSMVAMIVSLNPKVPVMMARTMWAPGILSICGARLRISRADQLPKDRSFIFVSNHLSYLDIPALFRAIPVNLHFVAKKEVQRMPFIGWYMWATGMIFIDRQNREKAIKSLDKAGKLIKAGKNVIMFPEGTRSKDSEVMPFKKGAFALAAQADLEVVPVALVNTEVVVPIEGLNICPGYVDVHIGSPMRKVEDESLPEFIDRVREELIALRSASSAQSTPLAATT